MFRFNWKLTLFTVLLLPLMISLGFWQLDREQQKIEMQERYERRSLEPAVALQTVNWHDPEADLGWMRIEATGYFVPERQFLLDNRVHESRVGYEVLSLFATDFGTLVVNRGWVPQGPTRQQLPAIPVSAERQTIAATIYVPDGEVMLLASDNPDPDNWPIVVQRLDMEQIAQLSGHTLLPWSVRLEPGTPAVLAPNWQAINMKPEMHRGYAVQWFSMAAVLALLYLLFSFRRSE